MRPLPMRAIGSSAEVIARNKIADHESLDDDAYAAIAEMHG